MKRILITGGFGYIGSTLLDRLLANPDLELTILDNLLYGQPAAVKPGIRHLDLDLTQIEDFTPILQGHAAVVHLAALVGDPICARHPELAEQTNRQAPLRLIDAARASGIGRFVFISTCSNYGKMPDNAGHVSEQDELRPVSLYAEQKVAIEKRLLGEHGGRFEPVVLRFATAYGISPGRMRFDLTVNEFTRDCTLKNELTVYGEHFWRPYCHVKDLATAIELSLSATAARVAGRVFNVGTTSENYTKAMLCGLLQAENPRLSISYVSQTDDPRDYRVDFSRIRDELGFRPEKTVRDGIREIALALARGEFADPYAGVHRNAL